MPEEFVVLKLVQLILSHQSTPNLCAYLKGKSIPAEIDNFRSLPEFAAEYIKFLNELSNSISLLVTC
ncbi:jg12703 [Pararge aegeria aegeria]|uniref:Jg12703 protein n=1 Tax=Pararge aegeria aegeria TaxID=348720 RepID=A0A8S4S2L0_9NEOP|nr:jg12703 [Pararge aegeria aegeria]